MFDLFPDSEWYWSRFMQSDKGGGGGGTDDDSADDDDSDDSDDDDGQPSLEDQLAAAKEALRKERQAHRQTKRSAKSASGNTNGSGTGNRSEKPTGDLGKMQAQLDKQSEIIRTLTERDQMNTAAAAVRKEASAAGAQDTDRIFRMLKSEIDYDDDGKPENVADLVADLKTEYPELFKKKGGGGDLGGGAGSGKGGKKGDWIRGLIDDE